MSRYVSTRRVHTRGLLSPAPCCRVNPGGAKTVEKAFAVVRQLSQMLRDEYVK